MTQLALAARSHIRNAVLCTLAAMTLAACDGESGSSSSAATSAAADTAASLVAPNAGMLNLSQDVDTTSTPATVAVSTATVTAPSTATVASNTTPTTPTTPITAPSSRTNIQNPAPVSGPTSTSNTTVTSGTRVGTPVKAPTPITTPTSGTTVAGTPPVKTTTTNGVATLDWMPPTQNSDGSVLTNLAGYTVYYGTSASNLTQSVKITNPGLAAYVVTNLTSGTWYFAVTSLSSTGVESTRTGTISLTI